MLDRHILKNSGIDRSSLFMKKLNRQASLSKPVDFCRWSEWRDLNPRPLGPERREKTFLLDLWCFLIVSVRFQLLYNSVQPHNIHVFHACLWSVMWSKPQTAIPSTEKSARIFIDGLHQCLQREVPPEDLRPP